MKALAVKTPWAGEEEGGVGEERGVVEGEGTPKRRGSCGKI